MYKTILEEIESLFQLAKEIQDKNLQIMNLFKMSQTAKSRFKDLHYSLQEAADEHCVSPKQFWRWLKAKKITPAYLGASPYFDKSTITQEIINNKLIKRKSPCKR